MKQHLFISLRMTALFVLLTCGVYPLLVFGIAQVVFPHQANGLSELIGQRFASPRLFHSRPGNYDAMNSGGTNLGPTSKTLRDNVAAAVRAYDAHANVPADAVTASASGLDPHISPANAYAQAPRVALANGLPLAEVNAMIARHTEPRFLGIFGEPRVNVLLLNLELERR